MKVEGIADKNVKITFLNEPKDAWSQPKAGQLVEVMRWDTALPNKEKVAELTGQICEVKNGYDPPRIHRPPRCRRGSR